MSVISRLRIHVTLFYDNEHVKDKEALEQLFRDEFKLTVTNGLDMKTGSRQKVKEIKDHLEGFKEDEKKYEKYDIFFFIFLTTLSTEGGPYALKAEDYDIQLDEIFDILKKEKPCLVTKPKIFLVQADDDRLKHARKGGDSKLTTTKIPSDSDRLLVFSTIPYRLKDKLEGKALPPRDEEDRCYLVDAFIKALKETENQNVDFLTLTTLINKKVSSYIADTKHGGPPLPLPLVSSTLTKLLYL